MDTNETPTPGTGPEPAAPHDPPRPAGEGFFTWLRGLGIVRPSERWFGGVAAGIAQRAGIDPLIVRGIFVALAIVGGPGILLYAIGWFLLPDANGRIEAERVIRGNGSGAGITLAIVIGVFVITTVFSGFGGFFSGGIVQWGLWGNLGIPQWISVLFAIMWWIALVGGIIWVIFLLIGRSNRRISPEDAARRKAEWAARGEQSAQQAAAWGASVGEKAGAWGETAGAKASAWSAEVGAKAGAWSAQASEGAQTVAAQVADWTDRDLEAHRRTALDPAHTILTLGAALLAGGAGAILAPSWGVSPLLAGALTATVPLGLSLIVAGLRGRRSGWIGFLSFVSAVSLLWVAFVPAQTEFRLFGDFDSRVTSVAVDTESGIGLLAGESTVDLRSLQEGGGTLDVWVLAGNARLLLPPNVPVQVEARTLAGQQTMIAQSGKKTVISGPLLSQTIESGGRVSDRNPETTVRVWLLAGNTVVTGASTPAALPSASAAQLPATSTLEVTR